MNNLKKLICDNNIDRNYLMNVLRINEFQLQYLEEQNTKISPRITYLLSAIFNVSVNYINGETDDWQV